MSEGRSRRAPTARSVKKHDALERLKQARSEGKNKYNFEEEEDVYDEVDEDTYASLVSKRQREDWIVDDVDGSYAENGREIFDDDFEDADDGENAGRSEGSSSIKRSRYSLKAKMHKSLHRSAEKPKKTDIRSMFKPQQIIANTSSKSMNEVQIDNDEIDSLVETITTNKAITPTISSSKSASAYTPLQLKKKTNTPVSAKRKLLTPSTRNPFGNDLLPPTKKRASGREAINFDDIIDQNEMLPSLLDRKSNKEPQVSLVLDHNEPVDEIEEFDTFDINDDDFKDLEIELEKSKAKKEIFAGEDESKKEKYEWKPTMLVDSTQTAPAVVSSTQMPAYDSVSDVDQKKTLRMFWFDAFLDPNHLTDTVYLFGRAMVDGKFTTCSVAVTNLNRRVFILPRAKHRGDQFRKVTMQDVLAEFTSRLKQRLNPSRCYSREVVKRYTFELDFVPDVAEYLEVHYPATSAPLPKDLLTGNTYRYVFGANTSILENLILDCKLKGPCWIEISEPMRHEPPSTWCKLELVIDSIKKIRVLDDSDSIPPSPDFTLLSLAVKNYVDPETKTNEIVAISCLVNRSYNFDRQPPEGKRYEEHFCLVCEPSSKKLNIPVDFTPKMALKDYHKTSIQRVNGERELLNLFLAKLSLADADIIVGHDIYDHDYDLLLDRFGHHKNSTLWSKLGRIRRAVIPKRRDKALLAGRLVCDVRRLAQELIKANSYDLTTLASQVLRKNRFQIGHDLLPRFYQSSSELLRMVEFAMKDNEMVLDIMYKINCLPLVRQISNVVGNMISRTMLYGRAERNEYLLLHAFKEANYIVPDKAERFVTVGANNNTKATLIETTTSTPEADDDDEEVASRATATAAGKKKSKASSSASTSYVGGLVLEPKVGYYDRYILLMDFNSLYPSIIQEYNICFTTVRSGDAENVVELATSLDARKDAQLPMGILPTQIKRLVESRREVKKAMTDQKISSEKRMQLEIKQLALKITANSMYGCLGFSQSRFYAKHLAAIVTYKGRDILMQTKSLVERLGYEVIYGDTDSIMILTTCANIDEVYQTGWKIQKEVNTMYNLLEIDIDGVFRSMLLLKKKKYAALVMERTAEAGQYKMKQEVKGLDIVRRDWSVISKEAGRKIIDIILEEPEQQIVVKVDRIHKYLQKLAAEIRGGELPLEKYVITKSLTKRPEDYAEAAKSLTHVTIAKRYNQLGLGKPLRSGDTVPYIICIDDTKNSATQRGYHLEEVRKSPDTLKVDIEYYFAQQLLPVISRLCDPIEGTDSGIIAELLGVQGHHPTKSAAVHHDLGLDIALDIGEHKFDCCQALMVQCPYEDCSKNIEIRDMYAAFNLKTTDQKKKALAELTDEKKAAAETCPSDLFKLTLSECVHCHGVFDPIRTTPWFAYQLTKNLKYHVNRYYKLVMVCDDFTCEYKTRYLTGDHNGKRLECPKCAGNLFNTSNEHQLYQQFSFYMEMFDFNKMMARFNSINLSEQQKKIRKEMRNNIQLKTLFQQLQNIIKRYLDCSAYNETDLSEIFRCFK